MPIRLLFRNLLSHPLRAGLTMASIVVAVFLICTLRALLVALNAGIETSASNRVWVQSAVSLFVDLPLSYQSRIAEVPGAEDVSKFQWFAGIYKEPKNFFAQFAVDPEKLLPMYPEVSIVDGSIEPFLTQRNACVVGIDLLKRFDWKVGDTIPLQGTIFPRADRGAWEFEIVGVYGSHVPGFDKTWLIFPFEYLRQSLESGDALGPDGVGTYVVRTARGADPTSIMGSIDALYENGPQRVQTTTEAEFNRQFVSMMGNIPFFLRSIGGGVTFAILLAALNTMMMAGRERTRDFGILKALGFTDGVAFRLLLAESMALCALGGAIGLLLFVGSEQAMIDALGKVFPGYRVTSETLIEGATLAVSVGLLAGIAPAWRASRLRPVAALREDA